MSGETKLKPSQKNSNKRHRLPTLSIYLKEIVYGGTDGIITTFAVVSGFAGAQQTEQLALPVIIVLLFGFANLFADAVSMGMSNFLSTRSEQEVYNTSKDQVRTQINTNPQQEKHHTIQTLKKQGFTNPQAQQLTNIYSQNQQYWLKFILNHELNIANPDNNHPAKAAFSTFISFIFFGFIPLLPYTFFQTNAQLFLFSIITTALALCSLGIIRSKITLISSWRGISETLLLGSLAASIAFFVGTFFKI